MPVRRGSESVDTGLTQRADGVLFGSAPQSLIEFGSNQFTSSGGTAFSLAPDGSSFNLLEVLPGDCKRRVRPMMGFKTFDSARKLIAGIETMHMVKKGQLRCPGGLVFSAADYFYSLAAR